MDTVPRQPARYHYEAAERLLAAAESSISAEMQTADALIAIGHAILANVDPQAAPSAGSAGIAAHWRLAAAALAQRRGLHRQGEVTMHVIHDTDRSCPTPWCSLRHRKHPVNECESAWFPTADHQVLLSNDAAEIEDEPILVLRRLRPDGYTVVSRMTLNEAREVADTLRFVVDLAEAD